jgi:cell division transport system ATP-binding protein
MSDHVIELKGANIYQEKNLILSDVNLQIDKGQFLYLVGQTGSGKSSLLKTMYADLPLVEGKGKVAGFSLKKLKRSKVPFLRRKIGIVFQDFQLLPDRSVFENMVFVMKATGWSKKQEIKARAEELLNQVSLSDKGDKMPHELSGGEQQRVAIARALINSPEIILADEPTGNLDTETSERIIHLLSDISMSGTAVLMATHDKSLMEKFKSKTIRCHEGKVTVE